MYVDPDNPAWDPEHPERNVPAARYAELAALIELPLVAELARWGDTDRRDADTLPGGVHRLITPDDWAAFRDGLRMSVSPNAGPPPKCRCHNSWVITATSGRSA